MTIRYCPYSGLALPDSAMNWEHPIPEAIGGGDVPHAVGWGVRFRDRGKLRPLAADPAFGRAPRGGRP